MEGKRNDRKWRSGAATEPQCLVKDAKNFGFYPKGSEKPLEVSRKEIRSNLHFKNTTQAKLWEISRKELE